VARILAKRGAVPARRRSDRPDDPRAPRRARRVRGPAVGAGVFDRRSVARPGRVREGGAMSTEGARTAAARAEEELAARRAAFDRATAAAEGGGHDADVVDLIDCALALLAAEALLAVDRASPARRP
jgi:hypothetical protein